jgi:hypothetical protein
MKDVNVGATTHGKTTLGITTVKRLRTMTFSITLLSILILYMSTRAETTLSIMAFRNQFNDTQHYRITVIEILI